MADEAKNNLEQTAQQAPVNINPANAEVKPVNTPNTKADNTQAAASATAKVVPPTGTARSTSPAKAAASPTPVGTTSPSMPIAALDTAKAAETKVAEKTPNISTPATPNAGTSSGTSAPVTAPEKVADKTADNATEKPADNAEGKNVFTELFGQDKSQKSSALMGNVVSQQDKKTKSLFGKSGSKLKTMKEKGKKSFKVSKSTPGKLVLQVAILLLVGVGAFFYTQNIASFEFLGTNPAKRVELAQETLNQENAEIIVQKYLSAALLLDQFSNAADEYLYNIGQAESSYTSQNKKTAYENLADGQLPEIKTLLQRINGYLDDNVGSEERSTAKKVVEDLIEELHSKSGEVDEDTLLQEIQDLENAKKLMQSKGFRDTIAALDFDNIGPEEVELAYEGYSDISASITAIIASIKEARMLWSEYLDELENLTKKVDPLFNTEFAGNLTLDDVKFSTNGNINVSGASATDDTKNFTLVSNLIDMYEASTSFEDVEDRSYAKSAGDEDSYTGQFRITMTLEGLVEILTDTE